MTSPDRVEILQAEARYHHERLALYRAKVYGGFMSHRYPQTIHPCQRRQSRDLARPETGDTASRTPAAASLGATESVTSRRFLASRTFT
jgi:hypothetical protein